MITNAEWDEMRVAQQMRLQLLRDEITEFRQGNRADALQGVRDGYSQQNGEGFPNSGANPGDINGANSVPEVLGGNSGEEVQQANASLPPNIG